MRSANECTMAHAIERIVRGRILIVEAEDGARAALVEILGEHGYFTEGAANGSEALQKIRDTCPDLVLTEYDMPEWRGAAWIEQVTAHAPAVPIVIMTAREAPKATGNARTFLTKPLDLDMLLGVLRCLLPRAAPPQS